MVIEDMYDKYDPQEAREYRAKTQKIYLINRDVTNNSAKFKVLGTTGKVYDIVLSGTPTCTCMDFQNRRAKCKHILFMLVRIFNVTDPYQDTFTTKEIRQYIKTYQKNIERFNIPYDEIEQCVSIQPKNLDDVCVICLDPLQNGLPYVYCRESCGRCLHKECHMATKKINTKCPYCMQLFVC